MVISFSVVVIVDVWTPVFFQFLTIRRYTFSWGTWKCKWVGSGLRNLKVWPQSPKDNCFRPIIHYCFHELFLSCLLGTLKALLHATEVLTAKWGVMSSGSTLCNPSFRCGKTISLLMLVIWRELTYCRHTPLQSTVRYRS